MQICYPLHLRRSRRGWLGTIAGAFGSHGPIGYRILFCFGRAKQRQCGLTSGLRQIFGPAREARGPCLLSFALYASSDMDKMCKPMVSDLRYLRRSNRSTLCHVIRECTPRDSSTMSWREAIMVKSILEQQGLRGFFRSTPCGARPLPVLPLRVCFDAQPLPLVIGG
jgi:hypothetical protein